MYDTRKRFQFLLLISLILIGVMGWRMGDAASAIRRKESQLRHELLATGYAGAVRNFIRTSQAALAEVSQLEGFSSMDPVVQRMLLQHVLRQNGQFLELSVCDLSGQETLRLRRFNDAAAPGAPNLLGQAPFEAAILKGVYVGSLERFKRIYPTVTLAVAIEEKGPDRRVARKGVLMAKVSLNGLTQMLQRQFPTDGSSSASVVSREGFLVAHSDPAQAYREDPGGSMDVLKDSPGFVAVRAPVPGLDWVVTVRRPIESVYREASPMERQFPRVLLWGIVIAILLCFASAQVPRGPVLRGKINYPGLPFS